MVGRSRWFACLGLLAALVVGCSRNHYRVAADRETYCILGEKTSLRPWQPPPGFTIQPDPSSRLFDPTPPDDPLLPMPAPHLYAYHLPELPQRDPDRFRTALMTPAAPAPGSAGEIQLAVVEGVAGCGGLVQPTSFPQGVPPLGAPDALDEVEAVPSIEEEPQAVLTVVPLPRSVWESLPRSCLVRMFEFASIREEYLRTTEHEPPAELRDHSPRLALEDIINLTLLNSRAYQTQKENLYRAALRLSLERYDYMLKFATSGNGTDAIFSHNRAGGITVNNLSIPTTVTGEKLLGIGGDLLARFANDVVLTFNGPDGFAADVGSELLLNLSHSVFQRDVGFEGLTQAERDVVYAARSFARFRKQLFRDMAFQYYSLILTYRGIEIDAQDYFSNTRGFNQSEAEYRAGQLPRFQVDQFEQNALTSRSRLIRSCNSLESSLDDLKLRIGLPPELPLNLDLTELDNLTLRDESTVTAELVRRARRNLVPERGRDQLDRSVLLNGAIELTDRMIALTELRIRLGIPTVSLDALQVLLARLKVDEARQLVRFNRQVLEEERTATRPVPPIRMFQRTMDTAASLIELIGLQLGLAEKTGADRVGLENVRTRLSGLDAGYESIRARLDQVVADRQLDQVPVMIQQAEGLLADAEKVAAEADALTGAPGLTPEQELQQTLEQVDWLLAQSATMVGDEAVGLAPVEIGMDDAMLTALVQRFDLMNERGSLADTWRRIKLAGDDLKSVLNLNASQSVRTRADVNRPFDFTFDESQTRLSLSFDTPLNRKAQRNAFRESLINYEAALRNLVEAEDVVKLSIRDDLRQLQLDREQYQIAVASAALAYERVVSTRLQLQLGVQDVTARDFLESQQAYTASLSSVAGEHIGYLRDRIQLFFDLELLEVDANGFWPELYSEQYEPKADYRWPPWACPPYGELPPGVWYSHKVKRMLHVPVGHPTIGQGQPEPPRDATSHAEPIPAPSPLELPPGDTRS